MGYLVCLLALLISVEAGDVIARLPHSVAPYKYRLDVNTRFQDHNFTFQGEVWIDLEALEPTNEIILNSKGLQIIEEAISLEMLTPSTQHFDVPDTWEGLGLDKYESTSVDQDHVDNTSPSNVEKTSTTTLAPDNLQGSTSSEMQGKAVESTLGVWSLLYETPSSTEPSLPPGETTTSVWELLYEKPNTTTLPPNSDSEIRDQNQISGITNTLEVTGTSASKEETTTSVWALLYEKPNATASEPSSEPEIQNPSQSSDTIGSTEELTKGESTTSIWSLLYQDKTSSPQEPSLAPVSLNSGEIQHEGSNTTESSAESTTSIWELLYQKPSESTSNPDVEISTRFADAEETSGSSTTSVWSLLYQETNSSSNQLDTQTSTSSPGGDTDTKLVVAIHKNADEVAIDGISIDKDSDFLIVKLKQKLEVSAKYRLHLKYSATLTSGIVGYNKISYKDLATNESRWMTSTVFEPMEARRAFPCFDEPNFKAKFQINLVRPKSMNSLSNMPLRKTYQISGRPDLEVDSYEESPPMSTYLVAFHVGDLGYRETKTHTGKPFRVYARPHILNHTDYVLDVGPKIQQFLGNYLQVDDPLNKTDLLALPMPLSDALENWGLISFFNERALMHKGASSMSSQLKVAGILAHELSHTWFGNLVTMDWWSDIWLNEGFATYFAGLAVEHIHPDWEFQSLLAMRAFLRVSSLDSLHTTHALSHDVTHKANTLSLFDRISYYKGHYILRMLRHMVGESTFRQGCTTYVKENLYANVKQNDFFEIMTKQAHEDGTLPRTMNLTKVMRAWTLEPGYPVITVLRDYQSHTAHIVQSRFLRPKYDVELRSGDAEEIVWWIPVTYTSQTKMDFNTTKPRLWVEPQTLITTVKDLPDEDKWVMFNIQATGFYRINYDLHNWELITRFLQSEDLEKVSVLNRAQLLDDVFNFARAGDVPYSVALNVTKYLKKERHFLPWMSVLHNMDYIMRMLKATNISDEFKEFVKTLLTPEFDRLQLEGRSGESVVDTTNRQQIVQWACHSGVDKCVEMAVAQYKDWIAKVDQDPTIESPIANDVRASVYCTAIENGGEHEWVFLWHRYLQQPDLALDQTTMLSALGCTKDVQILKRFLDMTIRDNSGLKKHHGVNVFKAVARNDVGHDLAKAFLAGKFNDIQTNNGDRIPIHFPILLDTLASNMNHQYQLNELQELGKGHGDSFRDSNSLAISNDKVKFNIEWLKRNYDSISSWLKSQKI